MLIGANRSFYPPNVADQNSANNVDCLAAALVFARTGDTTYRTRVVQALDDLAGLGNPGSNTLAWGRELGAYVLAADLVGYRTAAFETWLLDMAESYKGTDGRRLREVLRERPNNWGMQAFGTLVAVYAYLQDDAKLAAARDVWVQGVTGTPPLGEFGELSWHFDPAHPRIINSARSALRGLDIDGGIPDDLRRSGPLRPRPAATPKPARPLWSRRCHKRRRSPSKERPSLRRSPRSAFPRRSSRTPTTWPASTTSAPTTSAAGPGWSGSTG